MKTLASIASVGILLVAIPAQAGGLLPLGDAAEARMSEDDYVAMNKAVIEAAEDDNLPSTKVWTNPKSGSGGTVRASSTSAQECREMEHKMQVRGVSHHATTTLCRSANGWKAMSGNPLSREGKQ